MRFRPSLSFALLAVALAPVRMDAGPARPVAGAEFSCAVTGAGGVRCWGRNLDGELGDGNTVSRTLPADVVGLTSGVSMVAADTGHACALTTGGGVKCWGRNQEAQLGDGTTVGRLTPVDVSGLTAGVAAITAHYMGGCALMTAGGVRCWGTMQGGLGDGFTVQSTTPVTVVGLDDAVAIAGGGNSACAITSTGGAKCWGSNPDGRLGDGTTISRAAPVDVSGLTSGVAAIAPSGSRTCAVMTSGGVKCWGLPYPGALHGATPNLTAVDVPGIADAVSLVAGPYHTCVLTGTGGVWCWGHNPRGQVGDGTTTDRLTPVQVVGLSGGVRSLSAAPSGGHSIALLTDGRAVAWGAGVYGERGDGSTEMDQPTPVRVRNFGFHPGDLSGDTRSDVVWRNPTTGDVWVWGMAGTSFHQDHIATVAPEWEVQGVADWDGDWKADLLWRHRDTGEMYLWTMSGNSILAQEYIGAVNPLYAIIGRGDYNGDGRADVLWQHTLDGDVWVWLMDGARVTAVQYLATVLPAYEAKGSADLDGDGKADVLWRHATNGEVWVWLMDGTALQRVTYLGTLEDPLYQVAAVGDYDGDGDADVLWVHPATMQTWIFLMDGDTIVSQRSVDPTALGDSSYELAAGWDYDGDWLGDAFWFRPSTGETRLTPGTGWLDGAGAQFLLVSRAGDPGVPTAVDPGWVVVAPR